MVPSPVGDDAARPATDSAPAADASAASPMLPRVGQQLQSARLAKGLSANDVAKALKLSLRQVEALEADDWPSLPCNTIIRGFVRNYARLLGLDSDRLMADLDRLTLPPGAELEMTVGTPVSLPAEGRVDRRDFIRVLSGLIVLALAVAAYYFFPQDLWLSTVSALKSATESAAVKPVGSDNVRAADAEPATPPPVASTAVDTSPAIADTASVLAAANALPAATAVVASPEAPPAVATAAIGAKVLKFAFAQPSWVEVRDASGKVIFSKRNEAGSARDVEGQPPFALVIGNSAHVTLHYMGQPVDLSKRSKDDVARLTLE